MGGSIRQSFFRAIQHTFGNAGKVQGNAARSTAAPTETSATSPNDRWKETSSNLMEGLLKAGFVKGLTDKQLEDIQTKIQKDMEKFLLDNPKASPEDRDKESKKVTMRHLSMARFDKQREQKLQSRIAELRQDRWG